MQVLEEELQLYFATNELGSVSTMLHLLIFLFNFLFKLSNETEIFAYLAKARQLNFRLRYLTDH